MPVLKAEQTNTHHFFDFPQRTKAYNPNQPMMVYPHHWYFNTLPNRTNFVG